MVDDALNPLILNNCAVWPSTHCLKILSGFHQDIPGEPPALRSSAINLVLTLCALPSRQRRISSALRRHSFISSFRALSATVSLVNPSGLFSFCAMVIVLSLEILRLLPTKLLRSRSCSLAPLLILLVCSFPKPRSLPPAHRRNSTTKKCLAFSQRAPLAQSS